MILHLGENTRHCNQGQKIHSKKLPKIQHMVSSTGPKSGIRFYWIPNNNRLPRNNKPLPTTDSK